jgi:hypothetical protein
LQDHPRAGAEATTQHRSTSPPPVGATSEELEASERLARRLAEENEREQRFRPSFTSSYGFDTLENFGIFSSVRQSGQ